MQALGQSSRDSVGAVHAADTACVAPLRWNNIIFPEAIAQRSGAVDDVVHPAVEFVGEPASSPFVSPFATLCLQSTTSSSQLGPASQSAPLVHSQYLNRDGTSPTVQVHSLLHRPPTTEPIAVSASPPAPVARSLQRRCACCDAQVPVTSKRGEAVFLCLCCRQPRTSSEFGIIEFVRRLRRCTACSRGSRQLAEERLPENVRRAEAVDAALVLVENAVLSYGKTGEDIYDDSRLAVYRSQLVKLRAATLRNEGAMRCAVERGAQAMNYEFFDEWIMIETRRVRASVAMINVYCELVEASHLKLPAEALSGLKDAGIVPPIRPVPTECSTCQGKIKPPPRVTEAKAVQPSYCHCCRRMLPCVGMQRNVTGEMTTQCQDCTKPTTPEAPHTGNHGAQLAKSLRALRMLEKQMNQVMAVDSGLPTATTVKMLATRVEEIVAMHREALLRGRTSLADSQKLYQDRAEADEKLAAAIFAHASVLFPLALRHNLRLSSSIIELGNKVYKQGGMTRELWIRVNLSRSAPTNSKPNQPTAPSQSTTGEMVRAPAAGSYCRHCSGEAQHPPAAPHDYPDYCDCCEQVLPSSWVSIVKLDGPTTLVSLCRSCEQRRDTICQSIDTRRSLGRRHSERQWITRLFSLAEVITDKLATMESSQQASYKRSPLEMPSAVKQTRAQRDELYQKQLQIVRGGRAQADHRRQLYRDQVRLERVLVIALATHVLELIRIARGRSVEFRAGTVATLATLLQFVDAVEPVRWAKPLMMMHGYARLKAVVRANDSVAGGANGKRGASSSASSEPKKRKRDIEIPHFRRL